MSTYFRLLKKVCAFFLIAALCVGAAACARQKSVITDHRPDIFWPNPPEKKRIVFLNEITGPRDLNIHPGLLKKVFRYVAGIEEGRIVSPYGITCDTDGRLYVVDTALQGVHLFDAGANRYSVFPTDGSPLASPVGIAVDDNGGRIFVTDSRTGVVDVFKDQGKNRVTDFGQGLFKRPTGIAINPKTRELLVVDTLQSCVYRFDLETLAQKGSFGGDGDTEGRFHYPTHIAVTLDGNMVISDSLNFRVQVFSAQGRFLFRIGGVGSTPGTFSRPKGVASDSDGNIYVVDALFDTIQVFDKRGRLLMAFGSHGSGVGGFSLPTAIDIDRNDRIYVSDSSNRRVQVFQYLKEDMKK